MVWLDRVTRALPIVGRRTSKSTLSLQMWALLQSQKKQNAKVMFVSTAGRVIWLQDVLYNFIRSSSRKFAVQLCELQSRKISLFLAAPAKHASGESPLAAPTTSTAARPVRNLGRGLRKPLISISQSSDLVLQLDGSMVFGAWRRSRTVNLDGS